MLQSMNCIRAGQILLDENLHSFILCNNCIKDFRNINDFHKHLKQCTGYEKLFKGVPPVTLNYCRREKSEKLISKIEKVIKEYFIYNINDVEIFNTANSGHYLNLLNIEEELLNPRWYNEPTSESKFDITPKKNTIQKKVLQYDKLVEAVTPFVQFKENVKNKVRTSCKNLDNGLNSKKNINTENKTFKTTISDVNTTTTIAKKSTSHLKRKIYLSKAITTSLEQTLTKPLPAQLPIETFANNVMTDEEKKYKANSQISYQRNDGTSQSYEMLDSNEQLIKMPILDTNAAQHISKSNITNHFLSVNQTQTVTTQILNKLQTLGLQIRRTPISTNQANSSTTIGSAADRTTLELLAKLQSKGMKVKLLRTPSSNKIPNVKNATRVCNNLPKTNGSTALTLHKNLIIKKLS